MDSDLTKIRKLNRIRMSKISIKVFPKFKLVFQIFVFSEKTFFRIVDSSWMNKRLPDDFEIIDFSRRRRCRCRRRRCHCRHRHLRRCHRHPCRRCRRRRCKQIKRKKLNSEKRLILIFNFSFST